MLDCGLAPPTAFLSTRSTKIGWVTVVVEARGTTMWAMSVPSAPCCTSTVRPGNDLRTPDGSVKLKSTSNGSVKNLPVRVMISPPAAEPVDGATL